MKLLSSLLLLSLLSIGLSADPSNYEYYTQGGIKSGLKADSSHFTLNGKEVRLLSGSLHYFRLPKEYWRDRLLKMKAAGLNTVQTYSAWNLHEPHQGQFDFETGFLNLAEFLQTAKEVDLFVFFRIGPFINAEWEFGGYPSWLLKDRNMRFRSNYKGHLDAVGKYFEKTLSIIDKFQFQKGGPIVALQFENEFGGINNNDQRAYFQFMKDTIEKSGFKELLTNCDGSYATVNAAKHVLPGVLETYNGNGNSYTNLMALKGAQPNKPLFATEFWPGWFDDWGAGHHGMDVKYFEKEVTDILFKANASINYYMFFGGTNFGFTAGGDGKSSITTSYDYNAPLSESGGYTDKYYKTKELNEKLQKERNLPKIHIPDPPKVEPAVGYGDIKIKDYLSFDDLLSKITPKESNEVKQMEDVDQNFGFISYRISHNKFKHIKLPGGVRDRGIVIVDGKQVGQMVPGPSDYQLDVKDNDFDAKMTNHVLDVVVENIGRKKDGQGQDQRRGLFNNVEVDNQKINKYQIYSMEFKEDYVKQLKSMPGKPFEAGHTQHSPTLYRAELNINGKPSDTFLRFDKWTKCVVFVNNFNIGRYYNIGPQKTLYLPAPFLKTGVNDIYIFELFNNSDKIESVSMPHLG